MNSEHIQQRIQMIADDPLVALVRDNQPEGQWDLFLVGGTIRDILLNRPLMDRDFVVIGDTLEFTKRLAVRIGAKYVPLEEQWEMVRLVTRQRGKGGKQFLCYLDFSGLRGSTIEEDLLHRDFTINAMAVPLPQGRQIQPGPVHDPARGLEDIEKGILRAVSSENLQVDPVRVLRAFRLSATLGLTIDAETRKALALHAGKIWESAGERIRDELMKMLGSQFSIRALKGMESVGLLWELFPELKHLQGLDQGPLHPHDAWHHTLETFSALECLSERGYAEICPWDLSLRNDIEKNPHTLPLLKIAALLHDLGKPLTRSIGKDGQIHFYGHEHRGARMTLDIAKRLRLSRMDQNALWTLARYHMWPLHMYLSASRNRLSDRARIRYFRRLGVHGVGILLVAIADDLAKQVNRPSPGQDNSPFLTFVKSLLGLYYTRDAAGTRNPPLLTGHDLIQHFGLKPGLRIGHILEAIHEARVGGKVNDREEALEFARTLIHEA